MVVRHGESTWIAESRFQGRQDPPLSDLGRQQAQLVAARLANRDRDNPLPIPGGPPIGIWHSPLTRAADSAYAIAAAQPQPAPLTVADGLTEIAQGDWEGLPRSEVERRWPAELAAWRRSPGTDHAPRGESLAAAQERVTKVLDDVIHALASAPASGTVVYDRVPGYRMTGHAGGTDEPWAILVAHDGVFRLSLLTLLDVQLERFWSFPFNLAAITVVTLHEGVAALRAHNLSDHLAPLSAPRAAEEARGQRRGAL